MIQILTLYVQIFWFLHELLCQDGRHNYEGLQIPVHSQINFDKWKSYLQDYWDWQLPLLIKYGVPLIITVVTPFRMKKINRKCLAVLLSCRCVIQ